MDNTIDFKRLYELSIIEKEELLKKIDEYKQNIEELQINLEKYKNTQSRKKYYDNNKEKIIEYIKEYNKNYIRTPEKAKEYNKKAYEKRKNKKNEIIKENI
jgi:hypothetical protein